MTFLIHQLRLQCCYENLLERQRFRRKRFRIALAQALQQFGAGSIDDQLKFTPVAAHAQRRCEIEFWRRLSKPSADFLVTLAGLVSIKREHGAAAIDDGEL